MSSNNKRDKEARYPVGEDPGRTSVGQYPNTSDYPLEFGDIVWIVHPTLRAPLGEFRIVEALPNDEFSLVKVSDGSPYPNPVEKAYLKRDPYAVRR